MLSLEQIKLLEKKVEAAISTIKRLTDEREAFKLKLREKDKRISELEDMVVNFKDDQNKIENGIKNTLNLLNSLEDLALPSAENTMAVESQEHGQPILQSQAASKKQNDLAQILGKPSPVSQNGQADIF